MAANLSTASPKLRKEPPGFVILDENKDNDKETDAGSLHPPNNASGSRPTPLQSDTLANGQPVSNSKTANTELKSSIDSEDGGVDGILARMQEMQAKDSRASAVADQTAGDRSQVVMNKLIADLKAQNEHLKKGNPKAEDRPSNLESHAPVSESYNGLSPANAKASDSLSLEVAEMLRVRKELAAAKSVITRQEQELAESRNFKHTIDQAMGPPSEVDFGGRLNGSERMVNHTHAPFDTSARTPATRAEGWNSHEETRSDSSDIILTDNYARGRGIWTGPTSSSHGMGGNGGFSAAIQTPQPGLLGARSTSTAWPHVSNQAMNQGTAANQRVLSGPSVPYGVEGRFSDEASNMNSTGMRRAMSQYNRSNGSFNTRSTPFGSLGAGLAPLPSSPMSPISMGSSLAYQPRPIGTPLSATASEFTTNNFPASTHGWSAMNNAGSQTYVTPLEPMNYRRLLDKSVSCDWKYIVDKIVCSNDQQASIFLQQKLKLGTAEQKFEIVEAIVNQAYPLMINRFGNFLVQRCFEHGTPSQVIAIADAIHGNVLSLSMDAFGCHVIQKAFDSVPENHKADMVRELLRRIPDTVIHRYACHVWQKLFELRWSGEPPQIMLKVNEALRGMWHEVALGETGSLVVQNIFENCVEEEKRPAIEEVIASIDLIAHGQFGNWCIQHLCEHGSPPDKRRVIDHILTNAYSYSVDQFASKVVEKCLKIGGPEFLERYLAVVTTAHPDRPRIPLIDISGDQYGNYLVQWILMNTNHHQREQVASHIRKHMVSLRGSKFGSRVAMLCCNPASVTRPGPGVVVNPFGAPGQPRGCGWGRFR